MTNKRSALAGHVPRPLKRIAGSTSAGRTPLAIRTAGVEVDSELSKYFRQRLGTKLSKFAPLIERVTVRFEDTNGPRGGVDTVCRIKVVLSGLPSVVVEQTARKPREAFDVAADGTERTVRRALGRREISAPHKPRVTARSKRGALATKSTGRRPKRRPLPPPEQGSRIGRRVGRAQKNLTALIDRGDKASRELPIDTARPGWTATDRRAGGSSTAARNVKWNTARAAATLEDSAQQRPSRKSTRKSANRAKQDSNLRQRQVARARSPKSRARKATAGS
jgi:hypothetical protein